MQIYKHILRDVTRRFKIYQTVTSFTSTFKSTRHANEARCVYIKLSESEYLYKLHTSASLLTTTATSHTPTTRRTKFNLVQTIFSCPLISAKKVLLFIDWNLVGSPVYFF